MTVHTRTGTALLTGTLFDLLQLNCPWVTRIAPGKVGGGQERERNKLFTVYSSELLTLKKTPNISYNFF